MALPHLTIARSNRSQLPKRHRFTTAFISGLLAIGAMSLSSTLGNIHAASMHAKLFALVGAFAFLVFSVVAVQSTAATLGTIVTSEAGASGGMAMRVIASFVGYVIVLFVGLGLLNVPIGHLLIGGALTGVVIGIAAQQALGNVFAGIVLLLTRPFALGERVRVRAGALGGIFEGVVVAMTLSYVCIETDEGPVNVPNATLLSVGVGPAPSEKKSESLAVVRIGPSKPEPARGPRPRPRRPRNWAKSVKDLRR